MTWTASGGGVSLRIPDGAPVDGAPPGPVLHVGASAQSLPAPILPASGTDLPALEQANPPDIVSGWVRLWLAGFRATSPGWEGVVCARHGDVSHWLHVSADEIVSSQSFLTPRLITALGGADTACASAIDDSLSRPERLAAYLRAAEVAGRPEALTGHLIGAELAAARAYWLGQQVAVLGDTPDTGAYAVAIAAQGCPVDRASAAALLPKGLAALAEALGLDSR